DGLCQLLDWERAVRVHAPEALFIRAARRHHQFGRRIELRQHPVDGSEFHSTSDFTVACGNNCRISKMEIIGRMRMNRNIAATNSPTVPNRVKKSQRVG